MRLAIGLMSGTSVDGIDAALVRFDTDTRFQALEATYSLPYPDGLRRTLVGLGRAHDAHIGLHEWAALDVAVGEQFAQAANALLQKAAIAPTQVAVLGSHGQTVFHDPRGVRSSLQLGDPNVIAAHTGLTVAADFRRMDIALGGEGAPLVPAFHQATFGSAQPTAVVNIGGIANITQLADIADHVCGFDCGPGNALMDEWASRHTGQAFDTDGALAARGRVVQSLLDAWLAEAYFSQPPPKSTGRAQFNMAWLDQRTPGWQQYDAADVQASLCALTARTIADALAPGTTRVLVCGGGTANPLLMRVLTAAVEARLGGGVRVETTDHTGLPAQWVEAAAFAWLGLQRLDGRAGNCLPVTGAQRRAVLGGLYEGRRPSP
jgi:anhydro-N-acetylmuramic acid kinase